jgi:nucleoside-diphosphate-sugar epimerase
MLAIVGLNSFIARELMKRKLDTSGEFKAFDHNSTQKLLDCDGIKCIVNFAFHPLLYSEYYRPELDVDLKIADIALSKSAHYVMISSRKVYGRDLQWNSNTDETATGSDIYGKNKAHIENSMRKKLGENLTILRPGNVFGFERQPGRARFGAYLLNQLANKGEIRLTVSPLVRRDIVPVDYFCEVLHNVIEKKPGGIFNVGAGQAVEVGQVASWMLEGFGSGMLTAESTEVTDEFQLDSSRLKSEFGLSCSVEQIAQFSKGLGEKLRNEIDAKSTRA